MYVQTSTYSSPKRLVLFRGDAPEREADYREQGVCPKETPLADGWPGLAEIQLSKMEPDLIANLASAALLRHVTASSDGSPFVSFTDDQRRAAHYALAGGKRSSGILIVLDVEIRSAYSWQGASGGDIGWCANGGFEDALGRSWISAARAAFPAAEGIMNPGSVKQFNANGRRDHEYLVLGRIPPNELRIFRLKRS